MERVLYGMRAPALEVAGLCIMDLMHSEYRPGTVQPMHAHDNWQIMYFLRGSGTIRLNDAKVDFAGGYAIVIRPNEPHSYEISGTETAASFEVKCQFGEYLLDQYALPECSSVFRDEYGLRRIVNNALEELKNRPKNWDLMLRAYILELLIYIERALGNEFKKLGEERSPTKTYAYRHSVVRKAIQFFQDHLNHPVSVKDAADHLFLSPKYFYSLFKEETGETALEYLIGIKMKEAKRLLAETQLPVGDVGEAVGYTSVHYFSRLFKAKTGYAPTEYRALNMVDAGKQRTGEIHDIPTTR